ncbi:MAG: cyclic nucleotide-binding domain-containing protein [Planctomycetota bacterium]|jgi:CRP-like cAMP-binding protein|nr:cyclic nucleotide-binding domain-containing protein [Planctomycetota bacterium]
MCNDRDYKLSRFGKIALAKHYLTAADLQECVNIQEKYEEANRPVPQLGAIVIAKKFMTGEQVAEVLRLQNEELHAKASNQNIQRRYQPGEIIFSENDDNHDLFLLRRGAIEFYHNKVLVEVRSGENVYFGVAGYMLKKPRYATIVAKTACDVLQICEENANALFKMRPDLAFRLTATIAHSLQKNVDAYSQIIAALPPEIVKRAAATVTANVEVSPPAVFERAAPDPEVVGIKMPAPAAPVAPAPPASRVADDELAFNDDDDDAPLAAPVAATLASATPVSATPVSATLASAMPAPTPPPADFFSSPIPDSALPPSEPLPDEADKEVLPDDEPPTVAPDAAPKPAASPASPAPVAPVAPPTPPVKPVKTESVAAPTDTADAQETNGANALLAEIKRLQPKPLARDALKGVEKRIGLYLEIEKLEAQRGELEKKYSDASESFKIEIARQRREYVKIPKTDILQTQLEKLRDKLAYSPDADAAAKAATVIIPSAGAPAAAAPEKTPEEEAQERLEKIKKALFKQFGAAAETLDPSDFSDMEIADEPEEDAEGTDATPAAAPAASAEVAAPKPKLPPLTRDMRELLTIAVQQKELLLKRAAETGKLLRSCAASCDNEPFFQILRELHLDPEPVFGWGMLLLALKEYGETANNNIKAGRKRTAELNDPKNAPPKKKAGFFSFGKKKGDEPDEKEKELAAIAAAEIHWKLVATNVTRDAASDEPEMVAAFWDLYEKLGLQYVGGIAGKAGVFARAYLRWGMLGATSRWLTPDQLQTLVEDCFPAPERPTNRLEETAIYYADEVIFFTAKGFLPPSSNEDLELNHRNSKEWKIDRAWRKLVNCGAYNTALAQILEQQQKLIDEARANIESFNAMIEKTKASNNPDKKKIMVKLRDQSQNDKIKAARAEKIVEQLRGKTLPFNEEEMLRSREQLAEFSVEKPEELALAKHEIGCLRRNARLVAKLKEPFLPFSLRDRFKPDMGCASTRAAMLAMIDDVEKRDPIIFLEPLIPNAKKIHQVYMRRSPVMILAPAGGVMGFVMAPRQSSEGGRFILPAYVERANMREEILWSTLSDFRFDTSKASAGADLMTSDTLVAKYMEVRWNLRKREREARQKAGIYMEENERTNLRRHYAIYMKSAFDAGKQLFFKCPELYELVINKFIDLPAGQTILKR